MGSSLGSSDDFVLLDRRLGVSVYVQLGCDSAVDFVPSRSNLIYVSGPYTAATSAERQINVARAELVSIALISFGFSVFTPHKNTNGYEAYEREAGLSQNVWLDMDLEILSRCDGICMLPGWEESSGARIEQREAVLLGLRFYRAEFSEGLEDV